MNEFENINSSDLIYKFIDGDISHLEKTILFKALSENSDLQQEFQQAVTIQKGFEYDKLILEPSVNLTNKLFAKAGFSSLISTSSKFSFISNIVKPAIFTLIGVVLTATYFILTKNNSEFYEVRPNVIPQHKLAMNVPVEANELNKGIPYREVKKSNSIESKNYQNFDRITKEDIEVKPLNQNDLGLSSNYEKSYEVKSYDYDSNIDDNLFGGSIEIRGISGFAYLPDRLIYPQETKLGNNISVSFLKKIDVNNSLGIIFGQEALQLYTFSQHNGEFNFELQPNLFWIGALYRYCGDEIYGPIRPFAEVMLGGSKYGPLGKFTGGIIYNPQDFISMTLGFETTALMYKYLGKYNFTEKFSLVYGLGIHF